MPIRALPMLLVNQIAAGEVIERPASVIKELVENSLDAGATQIDITLEDGGRQLMRIADDGCGIPPDELPLALAPHATSKLQNAEQLGAIATLGFRGEALASIASVSRLKLSSRVRTTSADAHASSADETHDASHGYVLQVEGDITQPLQPCAMSQGTVLEVRDLFFNTPARRKFLRSAPTEFGHIAETVDRIALVHPHVGFTLRHNDRLVRELAPGSSPRERCVAVLGKELDPALLEVDEVNLQDRSYRVWGLIGLPAIARATARFQYLYVNHRPIRDRNLTHALREAYRGLMMPDLQPVAVVMISMPFAEVDVNVHPAKSEVRFREPSRLHGLVLTALRQRLLGADLTPKAGFSVTSSLHATLSASPAATPWDFATPTPGPAPENISHAISGNINAPADPSANSVRAFVDYFKRMAPQQQGLVYAQVKQTLAHEQPGLLENDATLLNAAGTGQADSTASSPVKSTPILQVHQSYVVTQDHDGLVIIDQHALHERVMFEELSRRVLGRGGSNKGDSNKDDEVSNAPGRLESQRLLMPEVIQADATTQALAQSLSPLWERIGIEIAPLGPTSLGVQAFPTFLFDRGVEPVEFITDLLDQAREGALDALMIHTPDSADSTKSSRRQSPPTREQQQQTQLAIEAALHKVLDMMSCKAAVKAGDRLSPDELSALLARRDEIERSGSCPHGRPTTLRLTLRDLEKQFKRTL